MFSKLVMDFLITKNGVAGKLARAVSAEHDMRNMLQNGFS